MVSLERLLNAKPPYSGFARADLLDGRKLLHERAAEEMRDFTGEEQEAFAAWEREANRRPQDEGRAAAPSQEWRTKDGKVVYALSRGQKLADAPGVERDDELSVGRFVQALITGNWKNAPAEQRAFAMGGGINTAGGYLVPDPIATQIVDRARNVSVLMRAGAVTVPMTSETLSIARVITDPTMQVKAENAAFDDAQPVLGAAQLTAFTVGCVVPMSRELVEDGINVVPMVEQVLAQAMGEQIDAYGLVGTGSAQPLGATRHLDVQTIGSVGSPSWDDLLDAIEDLELVNCSPNAWVTGPTVATTLRKLKSGDGTNSAALYLAPPQRVAELTSLVSNQCASGELYIADWSNVLFGVRTGAMIEVTTEGGESFARHQVRIKITTRFDVTLARPDHMVVLSGITS